MAAKAPGKGGEPVASPGEASSGAGAPSRQGAPAPDLKLSKEEEGEWHPCTPTLAPALPASDHPQT